MPHPAPSLSILFICHGNICRSPMAEFVLKKLSAEQAGLPHLQIESAAVSSEELGNPVYPPVRRILQANGMDCSGKTARQINREDYDRFDYIIAMDQSNLRRLQRLFPGDPLNKISKLMDWTDRPGDVDDPWYSGDFQKTWQEIIKGCNAILNSIRKSS